MIGAVLCVFCFVATYSATRRSLGLGVAVVLTIGYFYGVIRAWFPDGGTHFTYDAGMVALYLVHFTGAPDAEGESRSRLVRPWVVAFIVWPFVCMLFAAALPDTQPLLIQLVGLRAAAMYVPVLLIGARLRAEDLDRIAVVLAILNIVALGFGLYEFFFGVDSVFPLNRMTELIFRSHDIVADGVSHYRIPGPFSSAHAYGGIMAWSIPFLMHNVEKGGPKRILAWVGVGAAAVGVFLCGARSPVVILVGTTAYVLVTLRARWGTLLAVAICTVGVAYLVMHVERFQRFETLADTDMVEGRVAQSMNLSLIDALVQYPLGAGLASAFGTSIPFFLQDIARPCIGIESEFGRILIEQGLIGLALWIAFMVLSVTRRVTVRETSPLALSFGYATVLVTWLMGFIGAGLLAAIPATTFLFLFSGMRLAQPLAVTAKHSVRHVGERSPRKPLTPRLSRARRGVSAPISRTVSPS